MKMTLLFVAASLALASCSQQEAPASEKGSGTVAVQTGASLPAVTDQELNDLIDTVMQGVDVPKP